ncbi:molybdate ABC transporter substrate-binding protein [Paenibacillus apiarius]|uniref:Molybdate ABC transporter substrate-binding protein n=1 Tax=Paenibacillus apiarius TaxID=46240 RepID=A0ABT4E3E1_9BACL|nr:molybdate ABC transporter substrate-binding protein [Paenibacillus apiarius]MCY9515148.1 molybdate ABC transporter substrate-binding protein [Paenibacillus apiarius]MCY9522751.1 molybdate ABC transporter substrate-binding protein [Paenibacillus apiarius]MCY9552971.1 molybdate ABC transporter substrate-binding protein [Paenibacillus apiarius]MCY9557612.1 molybdate ABC transporter substrate-binding protein [Paenibacillus apiarius]MCY9686426.1 molybdate ABC transporter substrate-binding protei
MSKKKRRQPYLMNMRLGLMLTLILSLAALLASGCSANTGSGTEGNPDTQQSEVQLTVSAAASMQDALTELKQSYEKDHPNVKVQMNFGASGTLQKQIEQGAPTDVFISAGKKQMDELLQNGLIDDKWHRPLLKNDLVVIVPGNQAAEWTGLEPLDTEQVKRIAIGAPESVPAGSYAQEVLEKAKLWETLAEKFVLTKDVRQVLSYVETGNVDAGFVYRTDAITAKKALIACTVDSSMHKPIVYPIGIVKASSHQKEAQEWYQYLSGEEAGHIFERYGFHLAN